MPTNLAEESGRENPKEGRYFYQVAKGSISEVVSLLVMIDRRGYLAEEAYGENHKEAEKRIIGSVSEEWGRCLPEA